MNNYYHIEKSPAYCRSQNDGLDVFWVVRGKPQVDYQETTDDEDGAAIAMFFEEKDARLFLESVADRDGCYYITEIVQDK